MEPGFEFKIRILENLLTRISKRTSILVPMEATDGRCKIRYDRHNKVATFPENYGNVKVVDIRTVPGICKRPIYRPVPLPTTEKRDYTPVSEDALQFEPTSSTPQKRPRLPSDFNLAIP